MKDNQDKHQTEATMAPGMDDQEELTQSATQTELNKGEYTEVTTLSLDENDPS
ncbi:hypothetical protein [Mesobacillus campisalis]|uniref:hypothetical protein n=1 Tax=Mesobacillus campisalis TaxID=1408103 RepID=UPI000A8F90DA|nr:hypothetical protein [Mesobacillus campisalis]